MRSAAFLTTSGEVLVDALRNVYTPDELATLHARLVEDLDDGAPRADPLGILVEAIFVGVHQQPPPPPPETPQEHIPMPQQHVSPVVALRETYHPESYWPGEYLAGAAPILAGFGVLTRALDDDDRAAVAKVLGGLDDTGLDVTDVFPFGLVWALHSTGAIPELPGLHDELNSWREWEETDHLGEPLAFLPPLPGSESLT